MSISTEICTTIVFILCLDFLPECGLFQAEILDLIIIIIILANFGYIILVTIALGIIDLFTLCKKKKKKNRGVVVLGDKKIVMTSVDRSEKNRNSFKKPGDNQRILHKSQRLEKTVIL